MWISSDYQNIISSALYALRTPPKSYASADR